MYNASLTALFTTFLLLRGLGSAELDLTLKFRLVAGVELKFADEDTALLFWPAEVHVFGGQRFG